MSFWVIIFVVLMILIITYFQYFRVVKIVIVEDEENLFAKIKKRVELEQYKAVEFEVPKDENKAVAIRIITNTGCLMEDDTGKLFKLIWYRYSIVDVLVFKDGKLVNEEKINTRYQKLKVIKINK